MHREQFNIDFYKAADGKYGYNMSETASPIDSKKVRIKNKQATHNALRGEGSHFNVYSEDCIIKIIDLLKTGDYSYPQIAKIYNVPTGLVTSVANHHNWKYLTNNIIFPKPNKSERENVILTEADVLEIIKLLNDRYSNVYISNIMGVHPKTISDIRNHKTWKEFTDKIIFPKPSKVKTGLTTLQKKILDYYIMNPYESEANIATVIGTSVSMVNTTKNKYYDEYKESILCVDNNF